MQVAEKRKNPAAVALGRLGGKKRAVNLSAEDLSAQGRKAAAARWAKFEARGRARERRWRIADFGKARAGA